MSHLGRRNAQKAPDPKALYASRVRVYPMAVQGPMRRIKWAVLCVCLAIYYLLPWLRWNRGPGAPDQAVLLDIAQQRYYLFGLELWSQDITYLAGLLILAAVGLFLVTSLAGRVWCGYTCPQTVWTDLFMWIERLIEGDRNERMRRDSMPASTDSVVRKVVKHGLWLAIAFWTGGAWIMYYADAPTVTRAFWTGTAALPVYVFTGLFTLTTYTLAGWAREQVCTYMCPWPRFQSAMLDEQSFTVTYQAWRGEPRARGKRDATEPAAGDCIDCAACVNACPTGIDIRDGIQLECINCGLCMDACNHVMEKLDRKPWLIEWDTLARQTAKQEGRSAPLKLWRPRSIIYVAAMVLALAGMAVGLATRETLSISVLRDRAPLFVTLPDGQLRNGYTLRVLNKTRPATTYELRVADVAGAQLETSESDLWPAATVALPVGADQIASFRVTVTAAPRAMPSGSIPLTFVLREPATGDETRYRSVFLGPPGYSAPVSVP